MDGEYHLRETREELSIEAKEHVTSRDVAIMSRAAQDSVIDDDEETW